MPEPNQSLKEAVNDVLKELQEDEGESFFDQEPEDIADIMIDEYPSRFPQDTADSLIPYIIQWRKDNL